MVDGKNSVAGELHARNMIILIYNCVRCAVFIMAKLILRLSIVEKGNNGEEKSLVTKTLALEPKVVVVCY